MDIWITSFKESLLDFIAREMKAYRLYTVVPRLTKFIDQLTNWYVRMNRRRLKGEGGVKDCYHALNTLYDILNAMVKMMAPFTPFLTEYMYQRLRLLNEASVPGSVHYEMMPTSNSSLINVNIERAVARMQAVVELGRVMRDRRTVPIKYPLTEVVVIHRDQQYLDDIKSLQDFIASELNVRTIVLSQDKEKYGVSSRAEPDHKLLGLRLKGDFKIVSQKIRELTDAEIQKQSSRGWFEVGGHRLEAEEVHIIYQLKENSGGGDYEAHSDNDVLVLLNMKPNQELLDEGIAREIINRIQKLKKKAKLIPTDAVIITYSIAKNGDVSRISKSHREFIENVVKSKYVEHNQLADKRELIIEEMQELKDEKFMLKITSTSERALPKLPWINIALADDIQMRYVDNNSQPTGTFNLINFKGNLMTLKELKNEIESVFGIYGTSYTLATSEDGKNVVENVTKELAGKTIFVRRTDKGKFSSNFLNKNYPFSKFENKVVNGKEVTVYKENPTLKN